MGTKLIWEDPTVRIVDNENERFATVEYDFDWIGHMLKFTVYCHFGELLRAYRVAAGIPQEEFEFRKGRLTVLRDDAELVAAVLLCHFTDPANEDGVRAIFENATPLARKFAGRPRAHGERLLAKQTGQRRRIEARFPEIAADPLAWWPYEPGTGSEIASGVLPSSC